MSMTIEQDIARLDDLLRSLKAKYDLFFKGEVRTAPDDVENDLLTIIRTHGGRSISNPSLRFRYNNIVARYNSYRPLWARKRREIEEGKTVIPFTTGRRMTPTEPQPRPAEPPPPAPAATQAPARQPGSRPVATAILSSGSPDAGSVRRLYEAYVCALGPQGESRVPFQAFESQIRNQVSRHTADGAAGIKFQVVECDGKVRITSKPLRAQRSEG